MRDNPLLKLLVAAALILSFSGLTACVSVEDEDDGGHDADAELHVDVDD